MSTVYRERLTPPLSWWTGAVCFSLAIGWILLVATTWTPAIVATLLTATLTLTLVAKVGTTTIETSSAGLRVGDAFLDAEHVGAITALDHNAYRLRLGPHANAMAFLVTKPYIDRGVQVTVDDPSDPTPYWLISSRTPQNLTDALAAHVRDHGSIPASSDEGTA